MATGPIHIMIRTGRPDAVDFVEHNGDPKRGDPIPPRVAHSVESAAPWLRGRGNSANLPTDALVEPASNRGVWLSTGRVKPERA